MLPILLLSNDIFIVRLKNTFLVEIKLYVLRTYNLVFSCEACLDFLYLCGLIVFMWQSEISKVASLAVTGFQNKIWAV